MRFDLNLNIPSDLAVTSYGNLHGGTHIPNKQAIDMQQLLEGSHYRALPRLAKPPPLRKLSKSKKIKNKNVKKILSDFSNGKCAGEFEFENNENNFRFLMQLETIDGANSSARDFAFTGSNTYTQGYQSMVALGGRSPNLTFDHNTNIESRTMLAYRVLHLFLRAYGMIIGIESKQCFEVMADSVQQEWLKQAEMELALDMAIVRADVLVALGMNYSTVSDRIGKMAECLEASGRHLDAAKVYLDLTHPIWENSALMYCNAGLAFKYAEDFDRAEIAYINSWNRIAGPYSEPDDMGFGHIIHNILTLYYEYQTVRKRAAEVSNEKEQLYPVLSTLLQVVGYDESKKKCHQTFSPQILLKPSLVNNPHNALHILRNAASTPTINAFRHAILSSKNSNINFVSFCGGGKTSDPDLHANNMRNESISGFVTSGCVRTCFTCKRVEISDKKKLLSCPCKMVEYCDVECQKANWAEHKKQCAYHLKKLSEKRMGNVRD